MEDHPIPRKLWEHPNPTSTDMYKFMQGINKKHNLQLKTYWDLYQFSVTRRSDFWDECFQFLSFIYQGSYSKVVDESAPIDSIPHWFEGTYMNFAENLLYRRNREDPQFSRGTKGKEDDKVAITEVREGGTEIRHVTWGQLRSEVGELSIAMREHGVRKGDRIAAVASNSYDTLKVVLATTCLGALFSTSSTDMGTKGVLDRLLQIEPKFVFMDDAAFYNGKTIDLRQKMKDLIHGMRNVKGFKGLISMPRFNKPADISKIPRSQTLRAFVSKATSRTLFFERTSFRDPFFIAYSSGTTGVPKCIVHSIGAVVLASGREAIIHREIGPDTVALQYTTTGWIMYFASIMTLLPGGRTILYDGSPFKPNPLAFIKLLGDQKVTQLGTSPRWMSEIRHHNIVPREVTDLSNLRMVTSTGMVLSDQLFEWFYDVAFPSHTHLANISGGTDIAACFGQENPLTPVYVGGTQGPSLGTPVGVYDSLIEGGPGVQGEPAPEGTPGELVATAAFPNIPIFFWGDEAQPPSPKSKYFNSYFSKYAHVWTHGDFVYLHPVTHNLVFLGRADGVLNPSGVRFGSAEIYSIIDNLFAEQIADSICVGQRRPQDEDESVILFLLMQPGKKFTQTLVQDVKAAIRKGLSPRHVPKYVFETPEIPTTVNGKKVELPVKQIVCGKRIKPSGTLLNPGSLEFYYRFAKVEELVEPKSRL